MTIEELLNTTVALLDGDKKLGGWIDATHGDWLDVKEKRLITHG